MDKISNDGSDKIINAGFVMDCKKGKPGNIGAATHCGNCLKFTGIELLQDTQRFCKEYPDMCPIAGTGTLQCSRNIEFVASNQKCGYIITEIFFIKINCQKTTMLILKHGINTYGKIISTTIITTQMFFHNLRCQGLPASELTF